MNKVICSKAKDCEYGCKHQTPHEVEVLEGYEPGVEQRCTRWGSCTQQEKKIRCTKVKKEED